MAIETGSDFTGEPHDRRAELKSARRGQQHFPINQSLAEASSEIETRLLHKEGSEEYLDITAQSLREQNPKLLHTIQTRSAGLELSTGLGAAVHYELGAFMGYNIIEGQSDLPVPQVELDTFKAMAHSDAEERLLAKYPYGTYTPPSKPNSAYMSALLEGAPGKDDAPLEYRAYWQGATDVYCSLQVASEVQELERMYRLKRNRFA